MNKKIDVEKILFFIFLIACLLIGVSTLNSRIFSDEEDNFAVGSLILKGFLPYKDIFSHHFPFAYYWTFIVFLFAPNSIFVARFSILFFQIVIFGIIAFETKNYVAASIATITWILLRNFESGNMVLYHTFAAFSLTLIYAIVYGFVAETLLINTRRLIIIAFASMIAILSTPLSAYAVGVAYIAIIYKLIKLSKQRLLFIFVTISVGLIFIFIGYLIVTNTIIDFIEDAILFNKNIYAKYNSFYSFQLKRGVLTLIDNLISIFQLREHIWYNFDPMRPISREYGWIDQWIFTGFIFRASFIIYIIKNLINKKASAAIFIAFFAASILTIGRWGFHGQPLIVCGLYTTAMIIQGIKGERLNYKNIVNDLDFMVRMVLLLMVFWLNIRLINALHKNLDGLPYQKLYAPILKQSKKLKQLTCNNDDVTLLYYPNGYQYYFFTGIKPFSRHLAMWPWMAEIGEEEVLPFVYGYN